MVTVKRFLSLTFGLAAMTFTGFHVYDTILIAQRNWKIVQSIDVDFILRMIFYWPITIIRLEGKDLFFKFHSTFATDMEGQLFISPLGYAFLVTYIGTIIISMVLAKSLNRSFIDWGILSFIFPFLAPTILAIKKKKPEREVVTGFGANIIFGIIDSFFFKIITIIFSVIFAGSYSKAGEVSASNVGESKVCGKCGKAVPISASAGQSCPHCDAYWSSENKIQ
jgi:hypothetical protein